MKPPYLMSKVEWEAEREACRPNTLQTNFTRASASRAMQNFERMQFLTFGVHDECSQKMRDVVAGKIQLSPAEIDALLRQLSSPIRYEDVIRKATQEGLI